MGHRGSVHVARIRDAGAPPGRRVLVDRLWPRGVSKLGADLDRWCREVAPSHELRRWYGHDPDRFAEFTVRYHDELDTSARRAALDELHDLVDEGDVLLLTATRDVDISHAAVLQQVLEGRSGRSAGTDRAIRPVTDR